MDRLPIDVSDEISLAEAGLMGRATLLRVPDHVVNSVNVSVAHVDTNGPQGEAVLLAGTVDDDGRLDAADGWAEVPAGRGVSRRWV